MRPEFQKYLENIGVTKPIQNRVEHFYCLCRDVAFGQLLDVFIDDYLTEDKSRKYTGLSFYSKNYTFTIPNFLTSEEIGILSHHNVQSRITITVKNFDFKKANKDSLMNVELFHGHGSTGFYKASQENCKYLVRILRKYVRPSLRKIEIISG